MDRTLDVRTPESIAFSYELAGVGSRFLAVLIDLAVQISLLALIIWGLVEATIHLPRTPPRHSSLGDSIANAILIFIVFLIFFGYFVLFEAFWSGQTPGKRAMGIRVVSDGGYPVDFMASLVRNLIRVGEASLGFYVIAGIVAVASPQNKRLGDMAAGTIVVRDAKLSQTDLLRDLREEPAYAATTYLSGEERGIVKRFLERRDALAAERRKILAHQIAERVRPRLPEDLRKLDDEPLLERL